MSKVELRSIGKQYENKIDVIKHIDLTIHSGEFMVFVGPSGCGKSTLLRMIAGLEDITRGELCIGEAVMNQVPAAKRGISMVFQNYALYPHMTVYENMAFGLRLAGISKSKIDQLVGKAATILKLDTLLSRYPKALSGGQRQRVAIGRSIVRDPDVFLFDEPLSNLDAALRVQMRIELAKLHQQLGATMIYVTHDQVEAMTLGDRIAVFNGGNIEQVGSPMDLYRRPVNKFVATFIGSPAMNIIELDENNRRFFSLLTHEMLSSTPLAEGVSVGVRSEHIRLVPNKSDLISGTVTLVEQLGDSLIAYISSDISPNPIAVKVSGDDLGYSVEDHVSMQLDLGSCHYFNDTGAAIRWQ